MKNCDKYQTMKERVKVFETFCRKRHGMCLWCPYLARYFGDLCFNNWLNAEAEAEEEKKEDEKL